MFCQYFKEQNDRDDVVKVCIVLDLIIRQRLEFVRASIYHMDTAAVLVKVFEQS